MTPLPGCRKADNLAFYSIEGLFHITLELASWQRWCKEEDWKHMCLRCEWCQARPRINSGCRPGQVTCCVIVGAGVGFSVVASV